MGDTLTCPECGKEIESMDHLETAHEVAEVEPEDDGSFTLYENHDLFLCEGCKKPLGVNKRQ